MKYSLLLHHPAGAAASQTLLNSGEMSVYLMIHVPACISLFLSYYEVTLLFREDKELSESLLDVGIGTPDSILTYPQNLLGQIRTKVQLGQENK